MYIRHKEKSILIGKRIANIRKLAGMTQHQFAERIGITSKHLSEIERGISGFQLNTLLAIANKFDLPTDYILLNEDTGNHPINITMN